MKYVLKGNVVTFNSKRKVLHDGYVVVEEERIVYVSSGQEALPARFGDYTKIVDRRVYLPRTNRPT